MHKSTIVIIVLLMAAAPLFAYQSKNATNTNSSENSISQTTSNTWLFPLKSNNSTLVMVNIASGFGNLIHKKMISYAGKVKLLFILSEMGYTFAIEELEIKGTKKVFLRKMHHEDEAVFVEDIGNEKVNVTTFQDGFSGNIFQVNGKGNKYFGKTLRLKDNFVQVFNLSDV